MASVGVCSLPLALPDSGGGGAGWGGAPSTEWIGRDGHGSLLKRLDHAYAYAYATPRCVGRRDKTEWNGTNHRRSGHDVDKIIYYYSFCFGAKISW